MICAGGTAARRILMATVMMGAVAVAAGSAPAVARTVTVRPAADTYTRADHPRSSYGRRASLFVKGPRAARHAFIRFHVPVPPGHVVTKATLRLYATSRGGKAGVSLRAAAARAWSERRMSWRNEPGMGATVVDRAARYAKRRWVSLDATRLVRHGGRAGMALTTRGRRLRSFASRNARKASRRPRLVVETAPRSALGLGLPLAGGRYPVRGVFDRDLSATGFDDEAAIGFNSIDSSPNADQMNALAGRGLKGFIWLGGYSNTTCSFNEDDDWVRSHVAAVASSPAVGAYFIDDEPNPTTCPGAPAQMKARSDLVKSIDPGPPTFLVYNHPDRLKLFAGKVDVLGLNNYPCSVADGCEYDKIEAQAAEAERLAVRYWGVIQAYGGSSGYKVPTPEEVHQQFVHWRATRMEGYLVFAWRYPKDQPSVWVANNPAVQAQLAVENAR